MSSRYGQRAPRAMAHHLQRCEACGLVVAVAHVGPCPRCLGKLHVRRPQSITRTWALLLTATLLYIPSNTFPIMSVVKAGQYSSDTIISGVISLYTAGMWPLALIVLVASVFIPMLKLGALTTLLISVQRGSRVAPRTRLRLYRLTAWIGRWSMVDIFVITILTALVELGAVATITPAPGAFYFGMVVVFTLFAAESFDPRLIWDVMEESPES
ncbi:Paraquat-inducible protein A [Magnetococcus marinus MC-1]|uniref:Paraquat-inducible protein A n=1 Tax=Magnetococcus marinus (strain ATCC BAA-1437 / JCM 17883 / MC-1) TaxID=156889 RepID=A0LD18_MAGMM|nr:paraquat-inducible protein A [Magnetococcus marinus]ABK45861.1 Paraquat-inducible protein A [Magnetococcus marinus MC-1]